MQRRRAAEEQPLPWFGGAQAGSQSGALCSRQSDRDGVLVVDAGRFGRCARASALALVPLSLHCLPD